MHILMPNKTLWKFMLILLPFNVASIALVVMSMIQKNEVLLNVTTVFILCIILTFSLGSRIIRKDNIVLTNDNISFGLKNPNIGYFKMLLAQFEKDTIRYVDIITYTYNDATKALSVQTKQGVKVINLKHFKTRAIHKIMAHVSERTNNG